MRAKFKLKGKEIEIPDIVKVEGIKKFMGLMFKSRDTEALLFDFEKETSQAIHSLFCPNFLAIWLDKNNKILEHKLAYPNKFRIKPKNKFKKLLEIPLNNKYLTITKFFIEEKSL